MFNVKTMDGHTVEELKVTDIYSSYPVSGYINGVKQRWTVDGKWLINNRNQVSNVYIPHRLDLVVSLKC